MQQRRKRLSILVGVATAAILTLAACNVPAQPGSAPSSAAPDQPGSATVSESAGLAPNFQIAVYQGEDVLGGSEVEFSELLAQGKPVILNFWAGLCPPCRLEMPDFEEVHAEHKDKVTLLGLDVGTFTGLGSQEDGLALIQELKVTYPVGTTADAEVMRAYRVIGMPTTYFIKPNGQIFQKWTGILTRDKLAELTEQLVEASENS